MPRFTRDTLHPGQRVRIRSWASLAAEYGTAGDQIPCPLTFNHQMRQYCGRELQVREVSQRYGTVEFTEDLNWSWSPEMLEPIGKRCPRERVVSLYYATQTYHSNRLKARIAKLCRRHHVFC